MEWDDDLIAQIRTLWADGHSTAEIGRRLGVSKNAVVGKAHRLALPPRPSPIRRAPAGGLAQYSEPVGRPTVSTLPPLPAAAPPAVIIRPPPPVAAPAAVAAPRVAPVAPPPLAVVRPAPVRSSRLVTCCWPIGEPGTAAFHFCEDAALMGKPYCAAHAAIAYVKVRERREEAA